MHITTASPFEAWASFYVIVGSSAGAMTGLQFVVMTLIAQTRPGRSRGQAVSAFGTPNVVHFCAALLVASILAVPWSTLRPAGLAIAGSGLLGVFYSVIVIRRARRQDEYQPVFEDWLWHTILPVLAYSALFVAGAVLAGKPAGALLVMGAAALLLVFIGIHNAWDTVMYLMVSQRMPEPKEAPRGASDAGRASTPELGPGLHPTAQHEQADQASHDR